MSDPKIISMEIQDGGVAVLNYDVPGAPVNTLDDRAIGELLQCLDRIASEPGIRAAVLFGKPTNFVVGADINKLKMVVTEEDGYRLSREAQDALNKLEALPKPVIAAIHGPALGGGLELAMACHYRMATKDSQTILGLPEVKLGLLPGGGGTQRLPRLVPLQDAMDAVLTGKNFQPEKALELGLVDELALPYQLKEKALERARQMAAGVFTIKRKPPVFPPAKMLPGLYEQVKATITKQTRGVLPAPYEILESVYKGVTEGMEAGLEEEARRFGKLCITREAGSLIHLFFMDTAAKKDMGAAKGTKPLPVKKIGVLGAGIMGHGVAAVKADAGYMVRMRDRDAESAGKGLKAASEVLKGMWLKRPRGEFEYRRRMDLISVTGDYSGFKTVDVCIEAVFEDVGLKHQVIREAEAVLPERAVFASNTSAIPITRLAEASSRKENFLGMHYFSPVHRMPLIEIISTPYTSKEALATAYELCVRCRKTPIIVNDGVGFFTSRVISRYLQEAMFMLDEGGKIEVIDETAVRAGFPVGPVIVSDEVGLDTAAKVGKVIEEVFVKRFNPAPLIPKVVKEGRYGRKNQSGFYTYQAGKKGGPDPSVYELTAAGKARIDMSPEDIAQRLLLSFCAESALCLQENVLRSPRDGDVGAVMGIGFPANLGGPFHYMDVEGIQKVVDDMSRLEERFGSRFTAPEILKDMASSGRVFFPAS